MTIVKLIICGATRIHSQTEYEFPLGIRHQRRQWWCCGCCDFTIVLCVGIFRLYLLLPTGKNKYRFFAGNLSDSTFVNPPSQNHPVICSSEFMPRSSTLGNLVSNRLKCLCSSRVDLKQNDVAERQALHCGSCAVFLFCQLCNAWLVGSFNRIVKLVEILKTTRRPTLVCQSTCLPCDSVYSGSPHLNSRILYYIIWICNGAHLPFLHPGKREKAAETLSLLAFEFVSTPN